MRHEKNKMDNGSIVYDTPLQRMRTGKHAGKAYFRSHLHDKE